MTRNYNPTKLQGIIAIASFSVGTIISFICLFFIEPLGAIETSAISLVSEFLILCGALLGAKVAFDVRLQRFEGEMERRVKDAIDEESRRNNPEQ